MKKWCMLVMLWLFAIGYVSVQITADPVHEFTHKTASPPVN